MERDGLYQDMERKMFMEIGEHEIGAMNAASRTIRFLQLANGATYVDDAGTWKDVHGERLHALEDIVEEAAGMPVLFAHPASVGHGLNLQDILPDAMKRKGLK